MELVVLSGKGGTGKTTIATALSELASDVVRIDCDVDAPNFYLYYEGKNRNLEEKDFYSGKKAIIDENLCVKCGKCKTVCNFGAFDGLNINPLLCEGCGACSIVCDYSAISLVDEKTATSYITKLESGIISRATMEPSSDGSGKLISHLKANGKLFKKDEPFTIIDGSPGIGCPVISSITGSDSVLIVTEPTKSGLEDLVRVLSLCEYFGVYTMVCINKYDINNDMSDKIQSFLKEKNINLVGKIPYDDFVIKSINELKPITKYEESIANIEIQKMWINIKNLF